MGHDLQPGLVHYLGARDWLYANVVRVPCRESALWNCHVRSSKPILLVVLTTTNLPRGGLYGPAAATALEDLPYDARGILSGLYQQGYAVGYLLAAIFYRALVPTTTHGWRSLFWYVGNIRSVASV